MIEDARNLIVATDQTLIMEARRGDMRAFETLVQRYDSRVLAIAMSYVRDPDEAKDLYQEVFLRVYRALPKFEYRSQFSTWVYRIAVNVCKTHHMRRKRQNLVSLDRQTDPSGGRQEGLLADGRLVSRESADGQLLNTELSGQIGRAMQDLSPRQRLVFILKHYHGYKIREIASMMDCAQGTVKRHLFGATHQLRESLRVARKKEWQQ